MGDSAVCVSVAKVDNCGCFLTGGLTGFNVAKDLMKLDFSPPKEAPEEFRALTFSAPPTVKGQGRPALLASQIYHQGIPPLAAEYDVQGFGVDNGCCTSGLWLDVRMHAACQDFCVPVSSCCLFSH